MDKNKTAINGDLAGIEAGPGLGTFTDGRPSLGDRDGGTPINLLGSVHSEAALSKFT